MQLTGANLMMPGYDSCRMTHYNIVADSCEVNLAGNAIGTWSIGVPLSITPEVPVLVINVVNSPMASHIASSTDVVNTVFDDSDPTQDNVTCGYAGGCD